MWDEMCDDGTKCPYCGNQDEDLTDMLCETFQYDGQESSTECGECEKEYNITLSVSYTICSTKIPDLERTE